MNKKTVNGTTYHKDTATEVVNVLEQARVNHTRIEVDYGHTKGKDKGKSWGENATSRVISEDQQARARYHYSYTTQEVGEGVQC